MAKPLRSQLNQIRAWVRQGRTDAWIAHQLEVSATELREFRRRHELSAEEEEAGELELRDEIEAEIEAAALEEDEEEEDEEEAAADDEPVDPEEETGTTDEGAGERAESGGRRRRGRRGRRRGGRQKGALEATFEHGDTEGYGLWLDPAVKDDPVYEENWAGHRRVEVSIEPDQIVIKRA